MTGLPGRRPRVKLSKDEILRRRRYGDLRRLLRHRWGPVLPNDDAGREDLRELLLAISVSPHGDIKMRNAIEVWAPWMGKNEALDLIDHVSGMDISERKPKADILGERLNLTYAERAKLDIRTIRACDISEAGMALIRKQKRRQRARLRRQSRGAKSQADSISRTKPWIAAGFNTRRTWERKGKPSVATSCPIKLSTTEHEPATAGECEVASIPSLCVRLSPATTAGLARTYDDLWAEEAAWQSTWNDLEAAA